MKKIKAADLRFKDIEPFEHLEDTVRNTTPYQRFKCLEQMWEFWYMARKKLPKKIVELQDKFREGKI